MGNISWPMAMSQFIPSQHPQNINLFHWLCTKKLTVQNYIGHYYFISVNIPPPPNPAGRRCPEALYYAIVWTYIASTHQQSNALTLELFSTTVSHISDFWLNYRGRLGCTCQTSAESVKFSLKSDELWGARQVAMIDRQLDWSLQCSTSTELKSW